MNSDSFVKTTITSIILFVTNLLFGQVVRNVVMETDSVRIAVLQPDNWSIDTVRLIGYECHLTLHPNGLKDTNSAVLIRTFKKDALNKSIEYNTDHYSQKGEIQQLQNADKSHKTYSYLKMTMIEDIFFVNTYYVNPGDDFGYLIEVTAKQSNAQQNADLDKQFKSIVAALTVLPKS